MRQNCYEFEAGISEKREKALTEALIGDNRAHSPWAPGFYEKLGYTLYHKREDCSPGDTSLYYRKNLRPKETA